MSGTQGNVGNSAPEKYAQLVQRFGVPTVVIILDRTLHFLHKEQDNENFNNFDNSIKQILLNKIFYLYLFACTIANFLYMYYKIFCSSDQPKRNIIHKH